MSPQQRELLHELAAEMVGRSALQEIIALREQVDTLTQGQLFARLVSCLARLDAVCRHG